MKRFAFLMAALIAATLSLSSDANAYMQGTKESYYWYTDGSYTQVAGYFLLSCDGITGNRWGTITEYEIYTSEPC